MQRSSLTFFIASLTFFTGCGNANVSVSGIKSLVAGNQATPSGYNIGAGEAQLTNNSFIVKAKVIGFGAGTIVSGGYVTHGEVTP